MAHGTMGGGLKLNTGACPSYKQQAHQWVHHVQRGKAHQSRLERLVGGCRLHQRKGLK